MVLRVGAHQAKTSLSEYLNRVAYGGERVVIERHGKPVAALVSMEDLERLEGPEPAPGPQDDLAAREERFRRLALEAGVKIHFPTGRPILPSERRPIRVEGRLISEQIIEERR